MQPKDSRLLDVVLGTSLDLGNISQLTLGVKATPASPLHLQLHRPRESGAVQRQLPVTWAERSLHPVRQVSLTTEATWV